MATLSVAARNAALDAVIALAESPVGAGFPSVSVFVLTSGFSTLTSFFLPLGAWAPASGGSKALVAPVIFPVASSGTAAICQLVDRTFFVFINSLTVGDTGSGLEVEFSPDAAIVSGENYQLNELTLEVA